MQNLQKGLLKSRKTVLVLIMKTTKDEKTKLEDLRGKYVYIDVWATWCGPLEQKFLI